MAATIALIDTHICPNLAAQHLWGPVDGWTDTEGGKMEIVFPWDMGFLCRGVANKSDRRRGKATNLGSFGRRLSGRSPEA